MTLFWLALLGFLLCDLALLLYWLENRRLRNQVRTLENRLAVALKGFSRGGV